MSTEPRPAGENPGQPPQFAVDSSALSTVYANFCRVTGTPEELVLDFGLNTQMTPVPSVPSEKNAAPLESAAIDGHRRNARTVA